MSARVGGGVLLAVLLAGCAVEEAAARVRGEIRSVELGESRFVHDSLVTAVAFSPEGDRVVTGSEDGTIRVFDLEGYVVARRAPHSERVKAVGFLEDGTFVSASARRLRVGGLELESASESPTAIGLRHVAWMPGPGRIALVTSAGPVASFEGHDAEVLALSPSDSRLAVVTSTSVYTLDVATARRRASTPAPPPQWHRGPPTWCPRSAQFLDETRLVVFEIATYQFDVGRLEDLEPEAPPPLEHVGALALGRDGASARMRMTGSRSTTISLEHGARRWSTVVRSHWPSIAISRGGRAVAVTAYQGVILLRGEDGRPAWPKARSHAGIRKVAFDGEAVLGLADDGVLTRHERGALDRRESPGGPALDFAITGPGELAVPLHGRAATHVQRAAISRDGELLALVVGDGTIEVLDARTGAARNKWVYPSWTFGALDFSPSKEALVGITRGELLHFDIASGEARFLTERGCLGFRSTKDTLVWVDGECTVQPSGVKLAAWGRFAIFSPSADLVALGGGTRIPLLDVKTGRVLALLEGHAGVVTALAFSKDGRSLASGDESGALRRWEVR